VEILPLTVILLNLALSIALILAIASDR